MKKIFLGILMPLLCLTALIGTGFATWYFDDTMTATSQPTNVTDLKVEAYAQVGQLSVDAGPYAVTFDQPGKLQSDKSYLPTDLKNGITIDKAVTATYTPDATNAQNLTGELNVQITVPQALKDWVTLDSSKYQETGVGTGVYTLKTATTFAKQGNTTLTIDTADFDYKKAPVNKTEYDTFKKAVTGQIEIVFTAKVTQSVA